MQNRLISRKLTAIIGLSGFNMSESSGFARVSKNGSRSVGNKPGTGAGVSDVVIHPDTRQCAAGVGTLLTSHHLKPLIQSTSGRNARHAGCGTGTIGSQPYSIWSVGSHHLGLSETAISML